MSLVLQPSSLTFPLHPHSHLSPSPSHYTHTCTCHPRLPTIPTLIPVTLTFSLHPHSYLSPSPSHCTHTHTCHPHLLTAPTLIPVTLTFSLHPHSHLSPSPSHLTHTHTCHPHRSSLTSNSNVDIHCSPSLMQHTSQTCTSFPVHWHSLTVVPWPLNTIHMDPVQSPRRHVLEPLLQIKPSSL